MKWAKEHIHWTVADWNKVLWSDESPFLLRYAGRLRVWRHVNERYDVRAMKGTVKHDKKINIWGCFSAAGVGHMCQVHGILEQVQYKSILQRHMIPSALKLWPQSGVQTRPTWIFQQDNDPKHKAKSVQQYLSNKGVRILPWPSQSPDLNPIENLWSILDYKAKGRQPRNEADLLQMLQDDWAKLDPQILQNLVKSMPQRCQAVIDARGYPTKY